MATPTLEEITECPEEFLDDRRFKEAVLVLLLEMIAAAAPLKIAPLADSEE